MHDALRSRGGVIAAFAAILLDSLTVYAASTCQDPGDPRLYTNNPALYTTVKPGSIAASEIFCGNGRKYQNDPSNVSWCTQPMTPSFAICAPPVDSLAPGSGGGVVGCRANQFVAGRPVAVERAEVRGWVRDLVAQDDNEEEWKFNLVLDVGWTSLSQAFPINTLERINTYLPAYNLTAFSDRQTGGPSRAILHVEVDAWGPKRACFDVKQPVLQINATATACGYQYNSPFFFPGWQTNSVALTDLSIDNGPTYPTFLANYWPFPLFDPDGTPIVGEPGGMGIQPGDYVRVVGTLWLDGTHGTGSQWNGFQNDLGQTPPNGWREMHPVDYMAKICPPAQPHTVAMYAVVAPSSFATQTVHDVISNAAGAPIGSRMRIDPPYPTCSLRANFPVSVDSAFTRTSSVVRNDLAIAGQTATVDITVLSGGVKVAYDLSWSGNCANKCAGASDGCGGYCANNCNASLGFVCGPDGANCSCAPGTTLCGSSCVSLATDPTHCGSCTAAACNPGIACVGGVCQNPCHPQCGSANCGGPDGCGGTCPACCAKCSPP